MEHWILPWNKEVFDLSGCLAEYGFVDWHQTNRLSVGDVVFMYCSKPTGQIVYMFEVRNINIPNEHTANDVKYYTGKSSQKTATVYARLYPIAEASVDNEGLCHKRLTQLGMKYSLQSGIKVSGALLDHILSCFNMQYNPLEQCYTEGEATNMSVTSYERNPEARAKCLKKYGYKCQICEFDFEKTFGKIGHEFIHVHHITFISQQGGISHKVNPEKDLIPVCPNCHAMLHRKIGDKYLSPDELKAIVDSSR